MVLDASAVLALLRNEPGAERVVSALPGAWISSVNLAEVGSFFVNEGFEIGVVVSMIQEVPLRTVPFDDSLAFETAALRASTRHLGLSLGDRACLALARSFGLPALTADRIWKDLDIGIDIRLVRD